MKPIIPTLSGYDYKKRVSLVNIEFAMSVAFAALSQKNPTIKLYYLDRGFIYELMYDFLYREHTGDGLISVFSLVRYFMAKHKGRVGMSETVAC